MLGIPNHNHQLEVVKDITHQQVLFAEKVGSKNKTMVKLLKRDWKKVGMAKETMMNLISCNQPVMIALKKNPDNRAKTLSDIKKY